MTIHLNEIIIIGLCMFPAGLVLFYLLLAMFHKLEIGALGIAGGSALVCWISAIVMIVLGIGMEIH